jgi:hypothetical protein
VHAFIGISIFVGVIVCITLLGIFLANVDEEGAGPVAAVGSIISLVGFFIPWYWVSFSPPHGSTIVNGEVAKAATYTQTGLSGWPTTGALVLLFGISAGLPLATIYMRDALEDARQLVKVLHAAVQLLVCWAMLAFAWLSLAFWNTGFRQEFFAQEGRTQSALDASQYVSGHMGAGFILVTLGVVISTAVVIKELLIWVGVLFLLIIALAIFDSHGIGTVFHWLEFTGNY